MRYRHDVHGPPTRPTASATRPDPDRYDDPVGRSPDREFARPTPSAATTTTSASPERSPVYVAAVRPPPRPGPTLLRQGP
jgi:hypothetical protein